MLRRTSALLLLLGVWLTFGAAHARAGTVTMQACANGTSLSSAWTSAGGSAGGALGFQNCTPGHRLVISASGTVPANSEGHWQTTVPSGMVLQSFSVPAQSALINPGTSNDNGGSGLSARYAWAGGSQLVSDSGSNCCGGINYANAAGGAIGGATFAVSVLCTFSGQPCAFESNANNNPDVVDVENLTLTAQDNVPPGLSVSPALASGADLSGQANAWVRGPWNLWFTAANPTGSGVCGVAGYLDGTSLPGGSLQAPDQTVWQQCTASRGFDSSVNTTQYADGQHTIELDSIDAASPANHGALTERVGFDNTTPTVSVTGPADTASAGSPVDVNASATAGPSGVRGITCSVDGGTPVFTSGANATIPVSGLGAHQVSCYAQNNAVDNAGALGQSSTQTANVSLRNATSAAATFAKVIDPQICTHHGQHCRPRTIRKRVVVVKVITRHGKKVRVRHVKHVRVPVRPHVIAQPKLRVGYGHGTVLSGVLSAGAGGLSGQPVTIQAAPDNGLGQYQPIKTVTSGSNGEWSVKVPAGPSRLIRAVYAGDADNEPATSAPVTLTVPAKIRITSITPAHVAWGGTVQIHGQLYGGYLPPAGALVRLRYGTHGAATTYGVKTHVGGDGAFTTSFTFGKGNPADKERVAFQVGTLPTGDYPFAPASSNTAEVVVGGHPTPTTHHSKARGRHHRR